MVDLLHKRWAYGQSKFPRESFAMRMKRLFTRPWHVMLLIVGFVLVLSAAGMHAYSSFPVSISTNELELQANSELPVQIDVQTPYGKNAFVSFDVDYPSSVLSIDGELNSISTSFPIQRIMRVRALWDANPGIYVVKLMVHVKMDGQVFTETKFITVHVSPSSQVTYFTSPNSTFAPQVSSVVFSNENIVLQRNENASFSVSFVNKGSATDYLVRLAEHPIGITVHTTNDIHRFVEKNEGVTTFFEVSTSSFSPFEITPLRIESYDLVSGEKTFLGTVIVQVNEVSNIEMSIPFHEFVVEENDSIYSYVTLQNTEYSDVDLILESSSSLVEIQSRQVHIPSKSSLSVPLLIRASPFVGTRSETVFVMNSKITEQFSFVVTTVKKGTLPVLVDVNAGTDAPSSASGLVAGVLSPLVGLLIVVVAVLLIVSSRFRNWIKSKLPKAQVHEIQTKKPLDLSSDPKSKSN